MFGVFGFACFMYSRKQKAVVPLECGLVLMTFQYFVANAIVLAVIGTVLIFIPYFVRIRVMVNPDTCETRYSSVLSFCVGQIDGVR